MEPIKTITGYDKDTQAICDWIVELYNASSEWHENPMIIRNPESITVHYIPEVGGIILDQVNHAHHPNNPRTICQYLAIAKPHQRQGHGKRLVFEAVEQAAARKRPFIGAYVQFGNEVNFWEKLGYTESGNVGFSISATNKPLENCWDE